MFVGELACPLCNFEFEQWADRGYAFTDRGIVHCRLRNLLSASMAHYSESLIFSRLGLYVVVIGFNARVVCHRLAIVVVRYGQSPTV